MKVSLRGGSGAAKTAANNGERQAAQRHPRMS
jgi:hypothetical protein